MPATSTAQFAAAASIAPGPMGIYERRHHQPLAAGGVWGEHFRAPDYGSSAHAVAAMEAMEAKFEPADLEAEDDAGPVQEAALRRQHSPDSSDQEPARPREKIQRRLAQNREAARKSRLRKKAYIQNLETSRMKLARMEQELNRARQQGAYAGGSSSGSPVGLPASFDPGVPAFEMEYAHWVEEQGRQTAELRTVLQQAQAQGHDAAAAEVQLRVLVEAGLEHYDRLFRAKSAAAKSDVFFVMSGVWRPAADQFFLWIAGFRPSELLKVLAPQLGPLAEEQAAAVGRLRQTARQAEDALSQGMEKLQQSLAESLLLSTAATEEESGSDAAAGGCYVGRQMASAMGRLDELAVFVDQADHLRQQTLGNMRRILTAAQAARGLVALGDYCQRLRALSSLWAARPHEPA